MKKFLSKIELQKIYSKLENKGYQIFPEKNFLNKDYVVLVEKNGKEFVLKTNNFENYQIELFEFAREIEEDLTFKVPKIVEKGENFVLFEKIPLKTLSEFFSKKN